MPCFIIIEGIELRIRLFFDSVYAAIMWGYPWLKRVFGKVILSSISPNNNFNEKVTNLFTANFSLYRYYSYGILQRVQNELLSIEMCGCNV